MTWLSFAAGIVTCLISIGLSLGFCVFLWLRSQELPPDPQRSAVLRFWTGPTTYVEGIQLMRITNEQRVLVTAIALTRAGNPATMDGVVTFTASDESVARIDTVDGNTAYVTAIGEGAAQIFASFDADLGDGVRTIELSGAIEVVPAEAERGEIQFGTPELTPTPES